MAASLQSDFKIYNDEMQSGIWEQLVQNTDAFNAPSNNALRLVEESRLGAYRKEAFFQDTSSLIARRDITSNAAASGVNLTQDETIAVKVHRKIGPIDVTEDTIRAIGSDDREISFGIGEMIGRHKAENMVNTGLKALAAALTGQVAIQYDGSGQSTTSMITAHLIKGMAKMGDQSGKIVAWVMHSAPWFDLMGSQVTDKVTNVADVIIYGGAPGTLGLPVVVTDDAALINNSGSTTQTYNTLGLVQNALVVVESEQGAIHNQKVLGVENIYMRMQGEYAINVGCKGFKWDVTNGGATPTDATLGTSTNWDKVAAENKNLGGVLVITT